ncbi:MAG: gliding motility-associated C-terminal domain-containing protein [Bacteroidales bacterium]|nr:gliding motility-associated C-terminal domain-containing protein [Bacteroidales bacterium]
MKTKNRVKAILILTIIVLLSYSLKAQIGSPCPNFNFSQQNFTNWVCKTSNSINAASTAYSSLTWTGANPVSGRHTIMTDIYGYDLHTCNGSPNAQLALIPEGFNQSARIGNDYTMSEADAIIYELTVDTNSALILLHFAVVLQDPDHPASQQPYFELRIQDANGNLLNVPCNRYYVVSGAGIPGFQDCGDVHWRDWTTVGVSLFPLIGQTIYIVIATADCQPTGHYGYGYAVGECRPMRINVQYCEGSTVARLEAPDGFVSYQWRNQNNQIVGSNQKLSIQNPPDGATYTVTMTSAIGPHCTCNLSCVIEKTMIAPDFTIDSLTNICYPTKVHLAQFAYASGSEVSYLEWNISKVSENQGTEYMSGDSSLTYEFQDTGYYKILLTVYTENGCADTASAIVYSYPAPEVLITAPYLICKYTETEIFASGATTYQWGGVKRRNTDTSAIIDRGGMYTVKGTDDRGCFGYDTVYVDDLEFEIEYTTMDNPCYGYDTGTIKITKITGNFVTPMFHYWADLGYTNGMPTDKRDSLKAGFYVVYSEDDNGCFRYDTIEIKEPEDVTIVLDTLVGERCRVPGYIKIHAKGGTAPYNYSWTSDQFPSDEYPNPPFTDQNINELTPGFYTVKVVDKNGCPEKVKTYEVPIVENPIISVLQLIHETCSDENGSIRVLTQNPIPPLAYTWYYNNEVLDAATPDELKTGLKAGNYKIVVFAGNNPNCVDTVETNIFNHPIPEITLDTLFPEYCHRSDGYIKVSIKAHTTDSSDFNDSLTYSWSPVTGDTCYVDNLPKGTYTVTVSDGVCENSATYDVEFVEGPVADFVANSYNVATNIMFTLTDNTKGNPIIWLWDLDKGKSESGNVARVSFTEVGDYYVTLYVEDPNGCFDSITKKIHVYEELTVYVPNAFTPNGDGINDIFKPEMLENVKEGYVFEIFDRWGQKVFATTDTEEGWDGTIDKKPITVTSVFSYRIVARDFTGQDHEYVGHVTLLK